MAGSSIRSGPEIVKEFIERLGKDESLDRGTVETIKNLHGERKLTQIRLQQTLELRRKEAEKNG